MLLGGECDAGLSPWRETQLPKTIPTSGQEGVPTGRWHRRGTDRRGTDRTFLRHVQRKHEF